MEQRVKPRGDATEDDKYRNQLFDYTLIGRYMEVIPLNTARIQLRYSLRSRLWQSSLMSRVVCVEDHTGSIMAMGSPHMR
jgi:hypothetical protein